MIQQLNLWFFRLLLAVAVLAASLYSADAQEAADPFNLLKASNSDRFQTGRSKLALGLYDLYEEYQAFRRSSARTFQPTNPSLSLHGSEQIRVEVITHKADDADALRALRSIGLREVAQKERVINGVLPISNLVAAGGLEAVRYLRPVYARVHTGTVTSQGDAAQRSDVARIQEAVNGAGITIGVLSDSFDTAPNPTTDQALDIANGDLPRTVTVLSDYASGSDEGRAMAQLIYDVAPGLEELQFHTAFNGIADFADGIQELAAAGSDIIVDDVIYPAQPMFQDGLVAQAVDNVTAAGVRYFSAAGNTGRQSYEAPFRGQTIAALGNDRFHDFDPGPAVDLRQRVTLPPGGIATIFVQWTDPYFSVSGAPGAATDLDVFLVQPGTTTSLAGATFNNLASDPVEFVTYENTSDTTPLSAELVIQLADGPDPHRIKYVHFDDLVVEEFATRSPTAYGHPNAAGAIAVGAAAFFNTPEFGTNPARLNGFSSAGGIEILFDTDGNPTSKFRDKPEITAPDGGNTSFFGFDSAGDQDSLPNFFGTSAAAPHAAGVAALLLERHPELTPTEVERILRDSALDIVQRSGGAVIGTGSDPDSGAGLIQADVALAELRFCDLTADRTTVDFGPREIGLSHGPESIQFTNEGERPCTIEQISYSGDEWFSTNKRRFRRNVIPPVNPVLPGSSFTIDVFYEVTGSGDHQAMLHVESADPQSSGTLVVALQGSGIVRSGPTGEMCDPDRDSDTDLDDFQMIFDAATGAQAPDLARMDADGNGVITVKDVRLCVVR